MPIELEQTLQQHFHFNQFRPGQSQVIETLLAGHSAVAVFPTGGGKSLCYQLPSLLLPGLTLVVSPLIALMKDQIDALRSKNIPAQRLDSSLDATQYRHAMEQVRGGQLRLLYVAPERFNNERFRESVLPLTIDLFAIDEAHCISEWGHNFRPDYLKLAGFARQCGAGRVLALTATATPQVRDDICREFQIASENAVCTGFYRDNLTVLTTSTSDEHRDEVLVERLKQRQRGPTLVYVTLQQTAENVARRLSSHGLPAKAYHAGLKEDRRTAIQDEFITSDDGIVVATIAFGMGVDKANIRYVYHYNIPKSLENYSQEIGRAGRDGQSAICETLIAIEDLNTLENFAYGDTPTQRAVTEMLAEVLSLDSPFDVSYYELAGDFDIRVLVVRTIMTYLELEGYLEGGTPFYNTFAFKPRMSSAQILDRFQGERRTFLTSLLRQARKAKIWFHIDVEAAARNMDSDRQRVVRALDYLSDTQMIELQTRDVRYRYRVVKSCLDQDALAKDIHARLARREQREIDRLHQVLDLIQLDACQVAWLCEYFGEHRDESCGHCNWCLNQKAVKLAERPTPHIDTKLLDQTAALRHQHSDLLADSHALARLLCGLSSPKLTRVKLQRSELFGALSHVPFAIVRDACQVIEEPPE